MIVNEGKLTYIFDSNMEILKLDDSKFYRNKFIKIDEGLKSVDILAVSDINYLIEVKDYRHYKTEPIKQKELVSVLVKKVLDSIALIYPMKSKSNLINEKKIATKFLSNNKLIFIFHIELPPPRRTLKQSAFDLHIFEMKLHQKLKTILSKVKVVSKEENFLPWRVK